MGKNTLMRKVIKEYLKKNPGHPYKELSDQCKGNVGFVFTNSDLAVVRDKVWNAASRVSATAV
jgi:large subunit ribosomal protein LP0